MESISSKQSNTRSRSNTRSQSNTQPPQKQKLPKILKKFHKLQRYGKPIYIEAYRIMAASTEAIKIQFQGQDNYSATAYFVCLQEMMANYMKGRQSAQRPEINIEALSYCYSAVISMLDFGVI